MLRAGSAHVANEGRLSLFVALCGCRTLTLMRADPLGAGACMVGQVIPSAAAPVLTKSRMGANRLVDMLSGEQLPRICWKPHNVAQEEETVAQAHPCVYPSPIRILLRQDV